jgi:hypothetical protein
MPLRSYQTGLFDRLRAAGAHQRWLAAARETALMLSLVGAVCLSWPQVARSFLLATKLVIYYCFSPR